MTVARRKRPEPPSRAGAPPAAEHARSLVRRRTEALFALLPKARRGRDADAIHDLRVASRRLGEALALCPDGGSKARALVEEVALLRRAAGRLRDADVWLAWLRGAAANAKAERVAVEALLDSEGERRRKAARRCRERLAGIDARALEKSLRAFAKSAAADDGRRAADDSFRGLLLERDARAARLAATAAKSGDAEELHEARIAYKQLRYAAESAEGLFDARLLARLIRRLKDVQDVLGELHDRDVFLDRAARRGEKLADEAPQSRRDELRKSFEALSARLSRERERLLARFRRLVPGRAEPALAPTIRRGLASPRPKGGPRSRGAARGAGTRRTRVTAAAAAAPAATGARGGTTDSGGNGS